MKHLQENSQRSPSEIFGFLGISVDIVHSRITRLLENGTLRIIAVVNPHHISLGSLALLQMGVLAGYSIDEVTKAISGFYEVSCIPKVSGNFDLQMDAMCRDDDHLVRFTGRMRKIPGVCKMKSGTIPDVSNLKSTNLNLVEPNRHCLDKQERKITPELTGHMDIARLGSDPVNLHALQAPAKRNGTWTAQTMFKREPRAKIDIASRWAGGPVFLLYYSPLGSRIQASATDPARSLIGYYSRWLALRPSLLFYLYSQDFSFFIFSSLT